MRDLIERQKAIEAVFKDDRNTTIKQRLEALPSVQPDIVLCKDCKYFYENKWCIRYLKAFTPDDYCSCAERRDDGRD